MVKRVKIKSHVRDGSLIEEHEREVDDSKDLTLEQRIKLKKDDEEKQNILFGE